MVDIRSPGVKLLAWQDEDVLPWEQFKEPRHLLDVPPAGEVAMVEVLFRGMAAVGGNLPRLAMQPALLRLDCLLEGQGFFPLLADVMVVGKCPFDRVAEDGNDPDPRQRAGNALQAEWMEEVVG